MFSQNDFQVYEFLVFLQCTEAALGKSKMSIKSMWLVNVVFSKIRNTKTQSLLERHSPNAVQISDLQTIWNPQSSSLLQGMTSIQSLWYIQYIQMYNFKEGIDVHIVFVPNLPIKTFCIFRTFFVTFTCILNTSS